LVTALFGAIFLALAFESWALITNHGEDIISLIATAGAGTFSFSYSRRRQLYAWARIR